MNSPVRNNYAAPNTPIASSKRSKIVKKGNELASPTKLSYVTTSSSHNSSIIGGGGGGGGGGDAPSTPKRDTFDSSQYRTNMNMNMHLVSPSKNLFAPNGRPYQDHMEAVAQGTHYLGGFGTSGGSSSSSSSSTGGGGASTPIRAGSTTPAASFAVTSPSFAVSSSSSISKSSSYEASEQDENRNSKVDEKKAEVEEDDEDDDDVFNPYLFIARLPKHDDVRIPNKICLPPTTNTLRKTLVLDLDETLVHCTVEPIEHYDHKFKVE